MKWWPWTIIRKHDLRMLQLERAALLEVQGATVVELRKHRELVNRLATGEPSITTAIERARQSAS